MTIRRKTAVLMTAAALATTGAAMAQPASASPVFAGGLVNVAVEDVEIIEDSLNNIRILNDNQVSVGVVAQVVAQLCETNVGGILGELRETGEAACTTDNGDEINFTALQG